ncbi:MAG: valine--tRNA ligase [Candidatus Omnitrophica bacterium]|nr:valine--tRNA ligase [Candidatus Omnitrophota bacterium]
MNIPKKYNPKDFETDIFRMWEARGDFRASADSGKPPYTIVIPPPNVTGILHMGHALNNTLQDVLIRYHRMKGREALWMPGTDHAGIATQNVVEKQLAKEGKRKEDLGREKFTERLWQWRQQYGSTIINQLKKLGASCDWERTRFTMDESYSEAVNEVFLRLYRKGLIYRGNYIINWCPRCRTALSDEEAAHKELDGWLYHIKYPVRAKGQDGRNKEQEKYITVATTRPETMLGDTAVAVNPGDARYRWLKDAEVILPVLNRKLPVIEDDAVDPDFGTGVVKVTPAHDPADFLMGKTHGLDSINIMHEDAVLNENAGPFAGKDRFTARKELLARLKEEGLLAKKESYQVSAGRCYRCDTIIEPRLSLQWFVRMKPLSEPAVEVVTREKVRFYPDRWKKVYLNWMENIQDWCISRQIWWGHRIPVWYCQECINTQSEATGKRQDKGDESQRGVIAAKEKPEKCPDCGGTKLIQDPDVLDTWFSSWLWPFATFGWPFSREQESPIHDQQKELQFFYPTNTLVTGSEILFFWVARMIMAGLEFQQNIPFSDVVIHGTVRDEKGIKMSKSLGNVIDPLEIIEKFGADALRFSLMMLAASGSDVFLSDEKFLVGRNFCNKIWNAARFLLGKIEEEGIELCDLSCHCDGAADEWILREMNGAIEAVETNIESYRYNEAAKSIYEFFWHQYCDWYVEIAKVHFSPARAKIVILVLLNSLKLLHPFIPFLTEKIYQLIREQLGSLIRRRIIREPWPQKLSGEWDRGRKRDMEQLLDTIREIRNIKSDLGMGNKKVSLEVTAGEARDVWEENLDWIKKLAFIEHIEFRDGLKRTLYKGPRWILNIAEGDTDFSTYLATLKKKVANLEKVVQKSAKMLRNERFLHNAPPEAVEKERLKHGQLSGQLTRLKELKNAFE